MPSNGRHVSTCDGPRLNFRLENQTLAGEISLLEDRKLGRPQWKVASGIVIYCEIMYESVCSFHSELNEKM